MGETELSAETRKAVQDQIAGLCPPNYGLRHDGSEDPLASAYVEGLHDAWASFGDGNEWNPAENEAKALRDAADEWERIPRHTRPHHLDTWLRRRALVVERNARRAVSAGDAKGAK